MAEDGPGKKPYHHGNLRAALLEAAEAELAERGVEAFSLRQVARRAGVSHTAPQHHFGDVAGLLTALAIDGYRQMYADQLAVRGQDAAGQLVEAGLSYIRFAEERPTIFRLMFGSHKANYADEGLKAASEAVLAHVFALVMASGGKGPEDVAAVWGQAHGLAELSVTGKLGEVIGLEREGREEALRRILRKALP